MADTVRVTRKDLTSEEVLDELESGNRVMIELEVLRKPLRMVIREQEGTYYCDTPIKLLTFDSKADLQACLERYRLARKPTEDAVESSEPPVEAD